MRGTEITNNRIFLLLNVPVMLREQQYRPSTIMREGL